jgi:hypothetical protein
VSAANAAAGDTLATWPLVLVVAARGGAELLCRARAVMRWLGRTDRGWRRLLRRERRLARRRELRLFRQAQEKSLELLLEGENPLDSPDVLRLFRQLGNAAFDADLIGAWDTTPRPYAFETTCGQYRFRRL